VPGPSNPGSHFHKKPVTKPKVHHTKKPTVPVKHKAVQKHVAKPKVQVRVVRHPVANVVMASASSSALAQQQGHVVDLALQDVHVNLRRSSSGKQHHG
jgi:hypothetical protein